MKCKKNHVFKMPVGQLPVISVSIEDGDVDANYIGKILAIAKLVMICEKCGEEIILSGKGEKEIDVG